MSAAVSARAKPVAGFEMYSGERKDEASPSAGRVIWKR